LTAFNPGKEVIFYSLGECWVALGQANNAHADAVRLMNTVRLKKCDILFQKQLSV